MCLPILYDTYWVGGRGEWGGGDETKVVDGDQMQGSYSNWCTDQGARQKLSAMHYWSISNSLKWVIQTLAKYPTIYFTGIIGKIVDKFMDCQILANTLILKLNYSVNGNKLSNFCQGTWSVYQFEFDL